MNTNHQNIKQNNPYLIPGSIIVAGIIISIAILYSGGGFSFNSKSSNVDIDGTEEQTAPSAKTNQTAPSGKTLTQASSVNIADVDIQGEPFIGDQNAPVTLAYWFDYQCPFCRRFETQTLPALIDQYVKSGKLKVVFKDFQFLGADSQDGGYVEKAVWELYPDSYFKFHEAMFNAQDGENSGFGDLESILELIRNEVPQIDADKIAAQVEQKRSEYQQEQDADKSEGKKFGIRGTPGFVIGTQRISGAQPTSVFTQVIDAELNKLNKK